MEALRLAVRGLRWRSGSSLAVLVVAVVASAGAALGPLYAHSSSESLVKDGLATTAPVTTGVQIRANVAGQTEYSPARILAAVEARASDPALDPWYDAGTLAISVASGSPSVDGRRLGLAQVSWYRGACGGITVTSGRCPEGAGEAMVSTRFADSSVVPLGTTMQLGITSDPVADRVKVVGVYDATTADPAVWGLARPSQFEEARTEGGPDKLDEVVVDQATMLGSSGDLAAISLRTVDPDRVRLSDLDELRATVADFTSIQDPEAGEPRTSSVSGMPSYLDSLTPQLDAVSAASFAVTAQLVLLAWFVLFLVVAATSEERSGEVALAKLRGMSPRATLAFGLAEPLLLLALAVPLGLAVAWSVNVAMTNRYLVAGTSVSLDPAALVAVLVCFLGGAAAAALAARAILTAPVLDQLRRTGGRRAALARSAAVDGIAVALAAAGIYELRQGGVDSLALVAPGLIALATGLVAVRVLPLVARAEVARTRGSARLASFLASRNIARRAGGLRIVVLLTLAVGLAVFAVDGWVVAGANRTDVARAEVGAAEVLHVRASSPGELVSAVRAADPSGTQALAAVGVDNGGSGLLAVDSARLGAVAAWDPVWVGTSASEIGPLLHPAAAAEPIPVRGSFAMTVAYTRDPGAGELVLGIEVRAATGLAGRLSMGSLLAGEHTYAVDLPMCRDAPCSLSTITFRHPSGEIGVVSTGSLTISDARDASGPVDLSAPGPSGWRSGAMGSSLPVAPGTAELTEVADGALGVTLALPTLEDGAIEVADHPATLPVLQGAELAAVSGEQEAFPVVAGLDGQFVPIEVSGRGVLPRLLRQGTLTDLPYSLALMGNSPSPLDYQVWLTADAPAALRTALSSAGLDVVSTETITAREDQLGRSGAALALRLFLLAALVSLVLGAGTLLANAYVVIRRRAYELAALRALGASRVSLVRAARREQVTLALTGLVLGGMAGLVAAGFALPPLLANAAAAGPPPWFGPAWVPVVLVLAVVLVLLVVVADVGARRTVRRALPELLRQVQE